MTAAHIWAVFKATYYTLTPRRDLVILSHPVESASFSLETKHEIDADSANGHSRSLRVNVLMWSLVQYVRTDHCCINSYRGLQRSSSTNFSRDAPAQTYTANLQHRHLLRCSAQTSTEILSTDIYRGPSAQTCTEVFRVMSHCMAADVTVILSTESCRTPTEERFAHVCAVLYWIMLKVMHEINSQQELMIRGCTTSTTVNRTAVSYWNRHISSQNRAVFQWAE